MLKRCANCDHRIYDIRALMLGVYTCKCKLYDHFILHPFGMKGWRCKGWVKDGK